MFNIELCYFYTKQYHDYLGFDLLKFSKFIRIANGVADDKLISVADCISKYCNQDKINLIIRLIDG